MKRVLENEDNLDIMQGMVDELIIEDNEVKGVRTNHWVQNIVLKLSLLQLVHSYVEKLY